MEREIPRKGDGLTYDLCAKDDIVQINGKRFDEIDDIGPLTIVFDRYTGTYSGGEYTAWNLEAYKIPLEIYLDDCACAEFWENCDKSKIGIGDSVIDALVDLISKTDRR